MKGLRCAICASALVFGLALGLTTPAQAATYGTGDVFASLSGQVSEFTQAGVFVQTLSSGLSGFTTGSAFSNTNSLYVTDFSSGRVVTFANDAVNTQSTFGPGFSTPEDVAFDKGGNVYVGALGGGIQKFTSGGTALTTFASGHRVDWFDLNAGLTIAYYTDESGIIHRWDMVTNTAMSDLGSGGVFALRLLGDGTLLAADEGGGVNRIDATTGAILHNYSSASLGGHGDAWFSLNLDPNSTSFWTGSFADGTLDKVNIATGAIEQSWSACGGCGSSLYGVSLFGEKTQATVPEPASIILLGTGLVGLVVRKRLVK